MTFTIFTTVGRLIYVFICDKMWTFGPSSCNLCETRDDLLAADSDARRRLARLGR